MKRYSNKLIMTVMAGTALLFSACQEGDNPIDFINDNETRGAILRTVSLTSNELPIGVENSQFSGTFEVQDQEDGTLVDFVEVYVGFRDNTPDNGGPGNVPESLYETIDSSTFEVGEFGYPRFDYELSLDEMLDFTGLEESDLFGGDQFGVRFELVLNDGRRYSFADNTGTLTGSFFASPFLYTPNVICPVDATFFTGNYSITQLSGSAPFGIGDGFTQPTVTVVANGATNRTFGFSYDPGGFDIAYTMSIDLICGSFTNITGTINSGSLGCDGTSIGQTGSTTEITTYSAVDGDEQFIITISDFKPDGGCGGEYVAVLQLDKL
jgi:hypothetical protein